MSLFIRGRRLLLVGLVVVILAASVAVFFWFRYSADPSADEVRNAVARVAPEACPEDSLQVRSIDDLGGPGLPDGMLRAKEIVCARNEVDRLVVHYLFSSDDAARAWLEDNDFTPNDRWWLHGRTLTGAVTLNLDAWRRIREDEE
jgi:hypothetical protein